MIDDGARVTGYSFEEQIRQRINQVNSQVGWAAVLPDSFANQDAVAERIVRNDRTRISGQIDDCTLRAIAKSIVGRSRGDRSGQLPTYVDRDGQLCDPCENPRFNGLCAIPAFDPAYSILLEETYTWQDVAAKYLAARNYCDVRASGYRCASICDRVRENAWFADLAVKVGHDIVLFKCCASCRSWLDEPYDTRQYEFWLGFE